MKKLTQEEVIKRMQELEPNYDFSKFVYTRSIDKSTVICNKGHEYSVSWNKFKIGTRCPHCSKFHIKLDTKIVRDKMKELEPSYDFSKFEYITNITNSTIICSKGHEYRSSWNHFSRGSRCPKCSNRQSKPETEIIEFIKSFYNGTIEHGNRNIIPSIHTNRYLELDIYLPELKLAIEFNGKYWHNDEEYIKRGYKNKEEYHNYKTSKCKEKEIDLIHIFEENWIKDKQQILNNIKRIINGI